MTRLAPSLHPYDKYMECDPEELRTFLVADAQRGGFRWRGDDLLHGGARRTYIPNAKLLDRLLFKGSAEFQRRMSICVSAADRLMAEITGGEWSGNRVVINGMSPFASLVEHPDPEHFVDGVAVIGLGEADFFFRDASGEEVKIENPSASLMYVPPGVEHRVVNRESHRISIVVANDAQLASGRTAVGQYIDNLVTAD